MSYAIAKNELEGIWRVYCNECRKDIGTMTVEVLKRAIDFASVNGGVLCPECRSERCKNCGLTPVATPLHNGWCVFCNWETQTGEGGKIIQEASCLVNLNSTD